MSLIEEYKSKRKLIENYLNVNIDMETSLIVNNISVYGIKVSPRSVQRIRKEMKLKGKESMNDKNVFDTNKLKVTDGSWERWKDKNVFDTNSIVNPNQLSDDKIELINLINEGEWSIQELAEKTNFTELGISNLLSGKLKNYIKSEVLDEDNEGVYTNTASTGQQSVLDDLDKLDVGYKPTVVNSTTVEENFWEIEQECVTQCSKAEKEFDVYIGHYARHKAMCYMKWAGPREWLAYLIGKFEKGRYIISDLFLPNQSTSSALVNEVEAENYNSMNIVGVIHSHHEMGAGDENKPSFSGHDERFINSNHNLSLLAGRDRVGGGFKIVGLARTKTPCGAFIKVKAKVKYLAENPSRDKELKKEFLEKTQSNNGGFFNGGSNIYTGFHRKNSYSQGVSSGVKVNDKRTYTPGPDGVVQTRGKDYHFNN